VREVRMNPDETPSTFTSTAGGVMTTEAGAITGELELSTRPTGEILEVLVRYAGAEEWYTVEGSPVSLEEGTDPGKLHERIVAHLTEPGRRSRGNEEPVSLSSFSENA
jgi:hypothetical protein